MNEKLDRAIDKLKSVDDWDEDSRISVTIEQPEKKSVWPVQLLKTLPPWGRVIAVLAFLGLAFASGVGAQVVLHAIGVQK